MLDMWLARWREGRIGWHETEGNALLRRYWPRLMRGSRVLVPLCGKSVDMLWLAGQGLAVTGVEVSELAAAAFFEENDLPFAVEKESGVTCYRATGAPLRIVCADYFEFEAPPFHSLYDRGALVAIPADRRARYVQKTNALLEEGAFRLVIILSYDDSRVDGPPYSVGAEELLSYWPDLECMHSRNDLENSPAKFRDAGLEEVTESIWTSS